VFYNQEDLQDEYSIHEYLRGLQPVQEFTVKLVPNIYLDFKVEGMHLVPRKKNNINLLSQYKKDEKQVPLYNYGRKWSES
jgi:hypothetical protein